eukprot:g7980.t1
MSDIEIRRQYVLRVNVDEIHHIDESLRSTLGDLEFLRLAVVLEQEALTPFVTAKEMEFGELDFDKLMFIFVKEQVKYLFFNLYIAQPSQASDPRVLATGKLGISEVTSEGSVWTIPLSANGVEICELTFCINQLPSLEQNQEEDEYYPPDFTSAMDEVAIGMRKVTAPASQFCQTVAVEILKTPMRATSILKQLFCKLMQRLLS